MLGLVLKILLVLCGLLVIIAIPHYFKNDKYMPLTAIEKYVVNVSIVLFVIIAFVLKIYF